MIFKDVKTWWNLYCSWAKYFKDHFQNFLGCGNPVEGAEIEDEYVHQCLIFTHLRWSPVNIPFWTSIVWWKICKRPIWGGAGGGSWLYYYLYTMGHLKRMFENNLQDNNDKKYTLKSSINKIRWNKKIMSPYIEFCKCYEKLISAQYKHVIQASYEG